MTYLPGVAQPRVPAGPVLAEITRRGGNSAVLVGRRDRTSTDRAIYRGRSDGTFTVATADRIASDVLGLHPADLYGPSWWDVA